MRVDNVYTAISCNRHPTCLDIKNNNIIFGAKHAIAFFNLSRTDCLKTFVKHDSDVTTVKWVTNYGKKPPNSEEDLIFVSGSNNGNIIVWNISNEITSYVLSDNNGSCVTLDAAIVESEIWIVSSSSNNTVKLWKSCTKKFDFNCVQTIFLKNQFCFAIKFFVTLKNQVLLLIGAGENLQLWSLFETNFLKIIDISGHEDWIRCVDVIENDNNILLLSGSQDHFVRVWKLELKPPKDDDFKKEITMKEKTVTINNDNFILTLESVIPGHDGWVFSSQFFKNKTNVGIMTASIDKSIIVWYQGENGIWMDTHRIGEMGGSSLGFLGAKISLDGHVIIAHGFQGSLHIWYNNKNENNKHYFKREVVPSGHFDDVKDIAWAPNGEFLFSVSSDQTSRIHAPWNDKNIKKWNEIARVQIHGYDLTSISVLSEDAIATGAEEKVIRILNTTEHFKQKFKKICNKEVMERDQLSLNYFARSACVPSLGLSNKAVLETCESDLNSSISSELYTNTSENFYPPFEEDLMQNTLWPEKHKLYGHGFEIFSLASSTGGNLLASACRATNPEHAKIIIWDIQKAKEIQRLSGHNLTVTDLKFSPNNKYLLSTSRDRSWCIFKKKDLNSNLYELEVKAEKNSVFHTRIIWSCDWTFDSTIFATTSRDGSIAVWTKDNNINTPLKGWKLLDGIILKNQSVTAVSFSKRFYHDIVGEYMLAVGLENGQILLYSLNKVLNYVMTIDRNVAHHMTVRKLQWRPSENNEYLASCGEDGFVRIYNILKPQQ